MNFHSFMHSNDSSALMAQREAVSARFHNWFRYWFSFGFYFSFSGNRRASDSPA
jgi:hypothetical protein